MNYEEKFKANISLDSILLSDLSNQETFIESDIIKPLDYMTEFQKYKNNIHNCLNTDLISNKEFAQQIFKNRCKSLILYGMKEKSESIKNLEMIKKDLIFGSLTLIGTIINPIFSIGGIYYLFERDKIKQKIIDNYKNTTEDLLEKYLPSINIVANIIELELNNKKDYVKKKFNEKYNFI